MSMTKRELEIRVKTLTKNLAELEAENKQVYERLLSEGRTNAALLEEVDTYRNLLAVQKKFFVTVTRNLLREVNELRGKKQDMHEGIDGLYNNIALFKFRTFLHGEVVKYADLLELLADAFYGGRMD